MKQFKVLVALVLAMMLMLSVASVAFADAPTTGSITVNPNNKGQTYTLYKLFDAEITFDASTSGETTTYTQAAITYKLPSSKSDFKATVNGSEVDGGQWFETNSNGFVVKKDALTDDVMKSQAFRDWAKAFGTANATTKTATSDNDANVKWEGLSFGYYLVDSTLGSYIGIDTANPNATIRDKNNPPKLDKYITGVKTTGGADDGCIFNATDATEIQFTGDGSNEHAIAQIGDTITYNIDITIKPGAEAYVLTDVLEAGLTPPTAANVAVNQGQTSLKDDNNTKVTVGVSSQTITVTFAQSYLNTITTDTVVKVTYTATLNSNAVVASATDSNDNTATLTWGHKSTPDSTYDESKVWAAKISVDKKINSEDGAPLKDAGFVLARSVAAVGTEGQDGYVAAHLEYYKRAASTDVVTWVTDIEQATERITDANGAIAPFEGLPNGTYTLIEKTVPQGYNKTNNATITIANNNVTAANLAQTATVVNNAGTTLPTTGGIGTTIFYVAGIVLVLGAAAIIIARRKAEQN